MAMFKWAVGMAFLIGAGAVFAVRALDPAPAPSAAAVNVPAPGGCEDPKPEPLSLRLDGGGHAWSTLETREGQARVMVDTGASMTTLSAEDARRLGLAPFDAKRRKAQFQTANGVVIGELDRLLNVRLGHLCVYTLDVAIMPPGALNGSLLGMNFLRKMRKVEVGQGRLVISQ
jgi:aspartyl protease family protein